MPGTHRPHKFGPLRRAAVWSRPSEVIPPTRMPRSVGPRSHGFDWPKAPWSRPRCGCRNAPRCLRGTFIPIQAGDRDKCTPQGDTKAPGLLDEVLGVVALVRPYGQPTFAPTAFSGEERKSRIFFGRAGGLGQGAVDDEAVPVLHHDMSGVGELVFLAPALAGEPGLGIGPGGVGRVRTPLPVEVDRGVSACAPGGDVTAVLVLSLVFGSEALQGGGRLDQGAVHAEVLPGEELLRLCLLPDLLKEDAGHFGGQDTVPALGEARRVPGSLREPQPHERAEEQVVFQVFAELALRGDAVEGLQDQGAQETLRRDGDPTFLGIEGVGQRAHLPQGLIHEAADGAQGVIGRYAVLQALEHDEALLPLFISPHSVSLCHDLQGKPYQIGVRKDRGKRVMSEYYPWRFSAPC